MEEKGLYINYGKLNKLFPFFMLLDKSLVIREAGDVMKKLLPQVEGKNFDELFLIKRPFSLQLNFEAFLDYQRHVFILETLNKKESHFLWRGQVVLLESEHKLLFIGSPWITSTDELEKKNILISDFALHDTMPDMLQLLKTQEIVMTEMNEVTQMLNRQKEELVHASQMQKESEKLLIVQNAISKALSGALSFKTAINRIMKILCNHLQFDSSIFWMPCEENNEWKCKSYWQAHEDETDPFLSMSERKRNTRHLDVLKQKKAIWVQHKDQASEMGVLKTGTDLIQTILVFPIIVNSEVIGIMEFFSSLEKASDQRITQILETIGRQVGQFMIKTKFEERIKESEEKYKQLVEEATEIIYQTNPKGIFTYANKVALRIVDKKEEEFVGRHFLEFVRSDYRQMTERFYKEQFVNRIPLTYLEFPIINNKGEDVWIGQNLKLILKDGYVTGSQAIARDITERKKWEAELLKAKELAENSKKIKEQFLANMSHEIRTPMNAILGLTDILREGQLNKEQAECLGAIKLSAENLLSIINDILDFSKIESGKVVFENVPFKLTDVLEGIVQTLHFSASRKNLALIFSVAENVPPVLMGDTVRLRQILLNLASNSIKFTEKGSIKIDVGLNEIKEENYTLLFKVSDTGIGIAADKLSSIFESFTQATNDTTRKYGGTGLGLTIARELIQQQGGDIKVESELGRGSDFIFTIRYKKSETGENFTVVSDEPTYTFNELKGTKVLLVEDNVMNQLLAKKVLNKWNFIIDVADNGRIGVEKIERNEYDIVLMDMQMPEMDGYEATKHIRTSMSENKAAIPIMAMTAHAMVGEIEKCLSMGMNDYISKPFNQTQLYAKIMKLVKQRKNDSG